MSRAIKFRFYSKHVDDGRISVREQSLEDIENEDSWQGANPWRRIATCEHTGLHDKNGVEIYEGDIVAFTDAPLANRSSGHGGPKRPRLIEWKKNGYNLKNIGKGGIAHGVEVVGNIYENPELLDHRERKKDELR